MIRNSTVIDRPDVINDTDLLSKLGYEDNTAPKKLWILCHPASNRYGCFCFEGIHGLASFTTEAGAFRFAEWIDLSGMTSKEVTFEEALDIAAQRPPPVKVLMLVDNINKPKILATVK